jgi:hypothetical protein
MMYNRLDPPSVLGYILHQILWCPYFVGLDLVMRQHGYETVSISPPDTGPIHPVPEIW